MRTRRILRTGLAVLSLLSITGSLRGQDQKEVDELVRTLMRRFDVPGVALAIVRADSVVFLGGYGMARVRDSQPVDPARTLFRLASVSKLFVATAAMQQSERGLVDLKADVNRYLTWRVPDTWPEPITMHHLLTHTAGFDERLIGYASATRDGIGDLGTHLAARLPFRGWPPGDVIGYSNYGMALAAHVVERTSDQEFDRYARTEIFEPLRMMRTWYRSVPDDLQGDLADGHLCEETGCRPAAVVWSHPYPVGLAYSTAADMAQFLIAQVNGGATASGRVLQAGSVLKMQASQFSADPALQGMSYGFFNQLRRGHRVLSHAGNVPGTNNLLLLVPDARIGIYFVANGGRSAFGGALRDGLLDRMLPATDATQPGAISIGSSWVRSLAGSYQLTRYSHRTIERFPLVFATSFVVSADSGAIVLHYGNGPVRFAPVDSFHFREVGGERMIAFLPDSAGLVNRLAAPVPVFGAEHPGMFERRGRFQGAHFLNEYVSWLAIGPLLLLLPWPVLALIAWRRRRNAGWAPPDHAGLASFVLAAAVLFSLAWPAYGFAFIARSTRMFESSTGLVFGVSPEMRALSLIPWVLAGLSTLIVSGAVLAWRRGWWGVGRRLLLSVAALLAVLVINFLVRWNYLPPAM